MFFHSLTPLSSAGSVASVTGIVRYAYQCEHKTNPVYCTTRLASFHFAYLVSPRSAADLAWHGDSADSSAGSKTKRKKDGASPRARQLLGLVLAIMALAALAGLALGYACTRRRKRNYAFAQRSVTTCRRPIYSSFVCKSRDSPKATRHRSQLY